MKNKNIWLLPTKKPSRLYINSNKNLVVTKLDYGYPPCKNVNIYITSDEEIKDCNCYVINAVGEMGRKNVFKPIKVTEDIVRKEPLITYPNGGWCKKIILTTDPELIADGIQAIDDEFLEWFVKNPSCEYIDIEKFRNKWLEFETKQSFIYNYKIIIPKEEPKEDLGYTTKLGIEVSDKMVRAVMIPNEYFGKEEPKQENCCTPEGKIKRYLNCVGCDRKPKQKTLEEAAIMYAHKSFIWPLNKQGEKQSIPPGQVVPPGYVKHQKNAIKHFINGAKSDAAKEYWFNKFQEQDKNKFSEEDMVEAIRFGFDKGFCSNSSNKAENLGLSEQEWFEQFKNK